MLVTEFSQRLLAVAIDNRQPFGSHAIVHLGMLTMPFPDGFTVGRRILDAMRNQPSDGMLTDVFAFHGSTGAFAIDDPVNGKDTNAFTREPLHHA